MCFLQAINQVVLWDKIIQRGESAVLDYRSMNTKYYFHDDGHGLRLVLVIVLMNFEFIHIFRQGT